MSDQSVFPRVEPAAVGVKPQGLARVAEYFERLLAEGRFPGVALVCTRYGKLFYESYLGTWCSTTRRDNPLDARPWHMLYSFSKVVSATVIARLHQEGRLDYDVPVKEYIPEFAGGLRDEITLRTLLTHSAGIPGVPLAAVDTEERWQEAVETCCKYEPEWPPGTRTAYHGLSGLFVAAEAARRVSGGRTWEDLCREKLFAPLGGGFTFEKPQESEPVALTPQPEKLPCELSSKHYKLLGHPAGGIFGTPHAMLKLLNLHLEGGVWQGERLLAESEVAEMQRIQYAEAIARAKAEGRTPTHENWGLGWLVKGDSPNGWFGLGERLSPQAFGHAGIDTVIGVADPATGLALACLTTDSPGDAAFTSEFRATVSNLVTEALEEAG